MKLNLKLDLKFLVMGGGKGGTTFIAGATSIPDSRVSRNPGLVIQLTVMIQAVSLSPYSTPILLTNQ